MRSGGFIGAERCELFIIWSFGLISSIFFFSFSFFIFKFDLFFNFSKNGGIYLRERHSNY